MRKLSKNGLYVAIISAIVLATVTFILGRIMPNNTPVSSNNITVVINNDEIVLASDDVEEMLITFKPSTTPVISTLLCLIGV